MKLADAVAVVRTQGERTEQLCARLAFEQFDDVTLINVAPFGEAVRECYRIGIDSGAKWLVTIDADMLIAPDYAERMSDIVRDLPDDVWQVLGDTDDKLSMSVRQGGLRLHRVSALPGLIERVQDDAVRPESALCHAVGGWKYVNVVTCRHDYEQWFADLHRKGAQHRRKHKGWAWTVVPCWRESGDPDLVAAWQGWQGVALSCRREKAPL